MRLMERRAAAMGSHTCFRSESDGTLLSARLRGRGAAPELRGSCDVSSRRLVGAR